MSNTGPALADPVVSTIDVDVDQGLYLERLETLYEKSLSDIRAFAAREERSFEEVRVQLAEMHCKALFNLDCTINNPAVGASTTGLSPQGTERVSHILRSLSAALESLATIGGLQSFFLIVNPSDPQDEGFLGGTLLGREFWRGHRGCGAAGARAFQMYCRKVATDAVSGGSVLQDAKASSEVLVEGCTAPVPLLSLASSSSRVVDILAQSASIQPAHATAVKPGPAGALKTEVYAAVRNAVRQASGIRTAEMKWTNHANLTSYGVRLEGWPTDVPMRNPSTLTTAQNRRILEALGTGTLRFVPLHAGARTVGGFDVGEREKTEAVSLQEQEDSVFAETMNFSWDGGGVDGESAPTRAQVSQSFESTVTTAPLDIMHSSISDTTRSLEHVDKPPDAETPHKRKRGPSPD